MNILRSFLIRSLWASSLCMGATTPNESPETIAVALRFQNEDHNHDETLSLVLNKLTSFTANNGLRFDVTPRRLGKEKTAQHQTLVLEMIISKAHGKKQTVLASPHVSLENGGSALIREESDKGYELSVISLR